MFCCFSDLKIGDEYIPMAAGVESKMAAKFPIGKPENNYTVEVIVKVMDDYDLSATAETTVVQVSENIGNILFFHED